MSLVFSKALDDLNISIIRQMNQKKKPDTVDLGLGQLLLPSPQILRQAGADSFSSGSLGYSPTAGLPELREAIAENYNLDQSTNFNADNVVVTNGGEHALYCLAQALINPGDEILMPEISYPASILIAKTYQTSFLIKQRLLLLTHLPTQLVLFRAQRSLNELLS